MQLRLFVIFLQFSICLLGQTANRKDSLNLSLESVKTRSVSTIYIYRPYHFNGCAVKFNIQLNDIVGKNKMIYKIRNKGVLEIPIYIMQETELGLAGQRKEDIERFLAMPGTDYYFKVVFRHLVPILVSIDPVTGKEEYLKLKKRHSH